MAYKNILKLKYFILCLLIEGFSVSAYALKCENEFNVSLRVSRWMSFEEAKALMQEIGITSKTEFEKWNRSGQRPKKFPSNPRKVYADKWKGWGDFLGTGNILHGKREWMSFEEAKALMKTEGIISETQFRQWNRSGKRPRNFPGNPRRVYKDEWTSWGDFLGTGSVLYGKKEWMSFEEAKALMQEIGITSKTEFEKWRRSGQRPMNFPSNPRKVYKDKWKGWGDFLSTGNVSTENREWRSFEEAKALMQEIGITSKRQFRQWSKSEQRPMNFPSNPEKVYKDKWKGWGDFLSTLNRKIEWMSFGEAKALMKEIGIASLRQFRQWSKSGKRPRNFPSKPEKVYKDEWKGWGDFLGTGNVSTRKKEGMSFEELQDFLRSQEEWKQTKKRLENVLEDSNRNYFTEEQIAEERIKQLPSYSEIEWMSFGEAKKYVQSLDFETKEDFIEWLKSEDRPVNFPPNPHQVYSEWINTEDFLFTKKEIYIPYSRAKVFAQSLGVNNPKDFFEIKRNEPDIFPEGFPPNPKIFYSKTGEWEGWGDFLGFANTSQTEGIRMRMSEKKNQGSEDLQNEEELESGENFIDDEFMDADTL